MTALLSRKRKSPEPDRDGPNEGRLTTPTDSPARKKLKITQSQKQALLDNLQLESRFHVAHPWREMRRSSLDGTTLTSPSY